MVTGTSVVGLKYKGEEPVLFLWPSPKEKKRKKKKKKNAQFGCLFQME
jgi:hypothetical protein